MLYIWLCECAFRILTPPNCPQGTNSFISCMSSCVEVFLLGGPNHYVDFSLGSLMHLNAGVICSSYIRHIFLILQTRILRNTYAHFSSSQSGCYEFDSIPLIVLAALSVDSLSIDRTVNRTGSLFEPVGQNGRAVALRNLKRLRLGDSRIQLDEEFVNRYLTLRQVRGQRCRITSRDLLGCTQEQSSNTHLLRKLWAFPKHLKPNLDSEIDEALLVDASLLATTPPGIITEDVWVVDQACPPA